MKGNSRRFVCRFWPFCCALLLSIVLFSPARSVAQLYENALLPAKVREYYYTDDSGFVYRGGITLRDPFGVHGKTGTVTELSLNADRDLCSMTGLWTNYQAFFNAEILEDVFIGLVNNVAEAAIWTAFCSTEPVLCDLVKHMRAMARAGLQARLAQCGKVQDAAVEYGKDIWRESHKQCLEQKKTEGLSLDQAMEACGAHNVPVVNFAGTPVERLDLIDAALKTTNAPPELQTLAKEVLGEVTFSAAGSTTRTGHAPGRVAAKYEQMAEEKEADVLQRLNRIHESGTVTEEDLQALSTPSVPMTPRYLLLTARLPDGDRQVAALRMARALAMDKLLVQVKAIQEQLSAARRVPGGEAKAHALEIEIASLRREVDDLARSHELQERLVAGPMLEIMREVAQEEEATGFVGPGGGTDESQWAVKQLQNQVRQFGDIVGPPGTPAPSPPLR
jgi:hypothetical protein